MKDVKLCDFKDLPWCAKMYIYFIARNKNRFIHLDLQEVVGEISHLPKKCLQIFNKYIEFETKEDQRAVLFGREFFSWEHPYVKLEKALEIALGQSALPEEE